MEGRGHFVLLGKEFCARAREQRSHGLQLLFHILTNRLNGLEFLGLRVFLHHQSGIFQLQQRRNLIPRAVQRLNDGFQGTLLIFVGREEPFLELLVALHLLDGPGMPVNEPAKALTGIV